MNERAKQQLTLDFERGLSSLYGSGRELLQTAVHQQNRMQKAIAAEMDLSPSQLTRKLAQGPDDSARLTLDDAERFMEVTGDFSLIEYYIDRFIAKASVSKIQELEAELKRVRQQAGLPPAGSRAIR